MLDHVAAAVVNLCPGVMRIQLHRSIHTITGLYLKGLGCDASVVKPNVKEWLVNSKLTYAHGHSSFLVTPCPFCSQKNKNSSTTLFINKTTGSSVCKPCNLRGNNYNIIHGGDGAIDANFSNFG